MTNVTSAGQLAAVPIIAGGGSLYELAVSQLIINLRYALMSVSLSQKLGTSVRMSDRFLIAFMNTDEIFAVASAQPGTVGRRYLYALQLTPYLGWSIGTLLGAVAGNILPAVVSAALGLAIYGMFIAIILPPARKDRKVLFVVLIAAALSIVIRFCLPMISGGFSVIICALVASVVGALFFPVSDQQRGEGGA